MGTRASLLRSPAKGKSPREFDGLVSVLVCSRPLFLFFPPSPPPPPRSHCSFLVDSEVTSPALCALSVDILQEKGQLPVGEVGKLLQVRVCEASALVAIAVAAWHRRLSAQGIVVDDANPREKEGGP